MKIVTYAPMKHQPRMVVLFVVLRYMKANEVDQFTADLAKLKKVTDRLLIDRLRRHFDIERLRLSPMLPQDIMIYNYLQYEFKGKLLKTKLIARYDREVMRDELASNAELRVMLLDIGIDV